MWPFRRDRRPEGREPPTPGGSAAVTAPSGEWRRLPPVQRSVSGPALTLRAGGDFRRGLAGPHNPSFVGSLGHHVSALAPSGTVQGLATTIRPSSSAWQVPADLALRERPAPNGAVAPNGTGPPMAGTLDESPRRLAAVDAPLSDRPRPIDAPRVEAFRQLAPEPAVQALPDPVPDEEPAPPEPQWSTPDLGAETGNDNGDPANVDDPEDFDTPADSGGSARFGDPFELPGPSPGPAGFGDPFDRSSPSHAPGPPARIAPPIQLVSGRGTDRTRAIQRQPDAGSPAPTGQPERSLSAPGLPEPRSLAAPGQPEPGSPATANAFAGLTLRRAGDSVAADEAPDSPPRTSDDPVTPNDYS
ncbi:MAG: hypothetical protein QOF96_4086, partial [Actinomycetota bacterium]|nr:hypothetical protein [Actinomycetota bacterium]